MKMADVLRQLADKLDGIEGGTDQTNTDRPVEIEPGNDSTGDTFVPPLQQKIELLKKGVGVPSAFDQDDNGVPDELDAIKKNAGVSPAVVHIASDDEPLDV
jgi:hypothetical protein